MLSLTKVIGIREYIDSAGRSPFGSWFADLDVQAATKITVALERIAAGHTAAMKSAGGRCLRVQD